MSKDEVTEGIKYDEDKVRYDLLPPEALTKIAEIMTESVRNGKYPDRNWELGMDWSRLYRATLNHLFKWWNRMDIDSDSGQTALAHAATNLVFLLHYAKYRQEFDNRPVYNEDGGEVVERMCPPNCIGHKEGTQWCVVCKPT